MARFVSVGLSVFVWLLLLSCGSEAIHDAAEVTTEQEQSSLTAEAHAPPDDGVGTLGRIDTIKPQEQGLVLIQEGFDVEASNAPGNSLRSARHDLAVGARHATLQVQIRDHTTIWIDGAEATVSDLAEGMLVLVVGRVTGAALHADLITDLSGPSIDPDASDELDFALPPPTFDPIDPDDADGEQGLDMATTSLCLGQNLPHDSPSVLDFQGCWGGPSASGGVSLGFIPLVCPFAGCVGIDRVSYIAALGGWGFAFPFEFAVRTDENLVYHVPGDVQVRVIPHGSGANALTFSGGLGVEFGIRFRWQGPFGGYSLGTVHVSAYSSIQQSSGAAPLTGQRLNITSTSCPGVAVIPLKGFPIDPLSVSLCNDLAIGGSPFVSDLHVAGGTTPGPFSVEFGPSTHTLTVRPTAMGVDVMLDNFEWVPELHNGLYFQVSAFTKRLVRTPTVQLGSGHWPAITPAFPTRPFTVATAPPGSGSSSTYLQQPTTTGWFAFEVDPAPTVVEITSPALLAEEQPLTMRLSEAYDGSPIANETLIVTMRGLAGSADAVAHAVTDVNGIARLPLVPGEYALKVDYAGAETYEPSEASLALVTVYRPTTFTVWGGNANGLTIGELRQFWGSGWSQQVTGGSFGGNARFQGFVELVDGTHWRSPPGNAVARPDEMADVIGVIVVTETQDLGAEVLGNIDGYAVLRVVDPNSYGPGSGQRTWGVVRLRLE